MTKIKICGITREEDARACAQLGVEYLGFVFVKESKRYVDPMECGSIAAAFPHAPGFENRHAFDSAAQGKAAAMLPHCKRVGVFRDASVDEVHRIAQIARLDLVQLHGSEDEDYVRAIELPVIKVMRVEEFADTNAQYLMFDSGGGTGRVFDWSLLERYPRTKPFFLAGGLTPDNVVEAIRVTRPDVVDVSTGVEASPGIKDHQKLRDFIQKVRQP